MQPLRSGILEAIPGSRVIQFYGDAEHAETALHQYGKLLVGFTNDSPHILRVDPRLDFATIAQTVETLLTPRPLKERRAGT